MSSGNESAQGDGDGEGQEPAAEPTMQVDLFRARRADEREQQETQSAYIFPPEYAADPGSVFPDPPQTAPPYPPAPAGYEGAGYAGGGYAGGYAGSGYGGGAPGGPAGAGRWRSAAIFGGALVLAAALGIGLWAAFGSSGSGGTGASAGATATGTATGNAAGGESGAHAKAVTFRVRIQSVGADSFTGKMLADGKTVTIALTDKTHYGTKAHPFDRSRLTAGQTVIVHGRRTGTDTVTATVVAADIASAASSSPSPLRSAS